GRAEAEARRRSRPSRDRQTPRSAGRLSRSLTRGPGPSRPRSAPHRPGESAARDSQRTSVHDSAEPDQAAVEMRLDRAERPAGLDRDLIEAQAAEKAQRDRLAVRLVEAGDRRPEVGGP